eukprot:341868-Pleurochrysis_carterae.AAC.2
MMRSMCRWSVDACVFEAVILATDMPSDMRRKSSTTHYFRYGSPLVLKINTFARYMSSEEKVVRKFLDHRCDRTTLKKLTIASDHSPALI